MTGKLLHLVGPLLAWAMKRYHSFVDRLSGLRAKGSWLVASAGAAYGLAVSTNALRISAAIELRDAPVWIAPERAHVLLGTVIYLLALWLMHVTVSRLIPARTVGSASLAPFAWYVLIALGIPLANGAWRRAPFWDHASIVLLVVLAGAAAVLVERRARR